MSEIQRYGDAKRWADVVVHRGVAHWVEVAEDMSLDARGQDCTGARPDRRDAGGH